MKDPAFLFYSNDFDAKTKFFTHEQIGMYLRLMISQHQVGHLTESQMKFICGRYEKDVFEKFSKDSEGKFFNERLEFEINKRKGFCESRSKNRSVENKGKPVNTKKAPAVKKTATNPDRSALEIAVREENFKSTLRPFIGEHPKERIVSFYNYWSERSTDQKKMRFELQKTWELKKRLASWVKNEKPNFNNGQSTSKKGQPDIQAASDAATEILRQHAINRGWTSDTDTDPGAIGD